MIYNVIVIIKFTKYNKMNMVQWQVWCHSVYDSMGRSSFFGKKASIVAMHVRKAVAAKKKKTNSLPAPQCKHLESDSTSVIEFS